MKSEMIIGMFIISIVAMIMLLIGIFQIRKKDIPVGFHNMIDPSKKNEISDIIQWNKKHGMIWIIYGICIESQLENATPEMQNKRTELENWLEEKNK